MNKAERLEYLLALDEEILKGGVILSEWCSFIVRESDLAFVNGANLAAILTGASGVETYLRSECIEKNRSTLFELIENSPVSSDLRADLHTLRKYRNMWVHVEEPWNDQKLIGSPTESEIELAKMALFAARVLRKTIYENCWI